MHQSDENYNFKNDLFVLFSVKDTDWTIRLGQVQIHHELCPQYSELARQQGASAIRQMPALLGYQSNPPPGCLGDTFQ